MPEPPASAGNRTRPGARQRILAVFTELVASQGYDVTSLSEIAGELGLSKGTIMHHFGSKDRMLQEMSLGYMNRRLEELELIVAESRSDGDALLAVIAALLRAHRDDRAATVAFAREFMRFANEPVMTEVRELRTRYVTGVRDLIQSGIDDGTFRPLNPMVAALQLIGMVAWVWTWYHPDGTLSNEEIAASFGELALNGILRD